MFMSMVFKHPDVWGKPATAVCYFVLPLDVEKPILQQPPYVSACNNTVKFSWRLLSEEGWVLVSSVGNQPARTDL